MRVEELRFGDHYLEDHCSEAPLSSLYDRSVFNPNNYSPDTVIRVTGVDHTFAPENIILGEWRDRSSSKYYTDYRVVAGNHLTKIYRPFGVVVRSFDNKENILATCLEKEESIVRGRVPIRWQRGIIRLGEWIHRGVYDLMLPLFDETFYYEQFIQDTAIEILQVGKKIPERVEVKNPALSLEQI